MKDERAPAVDVRAATESTMEWVAELFPDSGVEVSVAIPSDTYVAVDLTALNVILANLLSNAVKFSPAGERVTMSGRTDGDLVTISITNVAPALTGEQRDQIYKPFIRLENAVASEVGPGAGLGLHLVRRSVDLCGGTVSVANSGNLVTFTLQLPAADAPGRVVDLRERQDLELE
jgi:signal transduction histidine kinase